ncbi:MAG TPA: BatA domain-containing protein [Verrucomicrobiaceae bacterium]
MHLILANPAGLWALAALPVVLLIHFLQEQSRRVRSSTLFLLERVKPESVGGSRFERLRHSLPLWLQMFAVAIMAWLLAEPRWIREDSRQAVVAVLDSSVSMSAFKAETRSMLQRQLARWSGAAAHTDWHLLESNPRAPRLYAGEDFNALLRAFDVWEPTQGTHAPDAALRTASGLVRNGAGIVVFVTDRKSGVPADVALMSAGSPIENVGFAGGDTKPAEGGSMKWRALIKNYGRERQERDWWIEEENNKLQNTKHKIMVEAGQAVNLEGEVPPDVERMTLVLSPDLFTLDDRLPLRKSKPRPVRVSVLLSGAPGDLMRKFFSAIEGVEMSSLNSDLVVDELGNAIETNAVQLGGSASESGVLDPAWVAAEDHRLTRDLAWSGLLSGRPLELTLGEGDVPLLWKGNRPLAFLRWGTTSDGRQIQRLILNWDLTQSNAARVPALPVMLQRFVEMVRERKLEPWSENFETAQMIPVSFPRDFSGKLELKANGERTAFEGRALERPGFFEVLRDGKALITGAAHFADTREADFRDAAALDTSEGRRLESALKQSEADPWMPLWVLFLAGCLIGSWAWKTSKSVGGRPVSQWAKSSETVKP